MKNTDHCLLCMHREFELKEGTYCGLTENKPDFETVCPTFEPNDELEEKIKSFNIELHEMEKLRPHALFQSGLLLLVSALLLGGSYLYGAYIADHGWFSTVPIVIAGAGFLTLTRAMGPFNTWKSKLANARKDKTTLDNTINLYGIDYDIDIQFARRYHGITEYNTNLKMKRKAAYQKAVDSQTQYMK